MEGGVCLFLGEIMGISKGLSSLAGPVVPHSEQFRITSGTPEIYREEYTDFFLCRKGLRI